MSEGIEHDVENHEDLDYEAPRMRELLRSGEVTRFHACPEVPPQTVAAHSAGVAMLASYIKVDPRPGFLMHCLSHDCQELFTGDVPFTAKREVPKLAEALAEAEDHYAKEFLFMLPRITKAEKLVMKLADMIEGLRWTALYARDTVVHNRWFWALEEMFWSEEVNTLLEPSERERAYRMFLTFCGNHFQHKTFETHSGFIAIRGKQSLANAKRQLEGTQQ